MSSSQLSTDIARQQVRCYPIDLNNVVASILMSNKSDKLPLSMLMRHCLRVYQYIRQSNINTIMSIEPSKSAVLTVLSGLGFKTQAVMVTEGEETGVAANATDN